MFQKRDRFHSSALMVDIETLDVLPTAVPLSIGAVIFDPYRVDTFNALRTRSFYVNIDRIDAERYGLTVSEGTLAWWQQQSAEAWAALQVNPVPLRDALHQFIVWALAHENAISSVWAKSPTFDCVILRNAMRVCGLQWPWSFQIERDHRTLLDAAYPQWEKPDHLSGRIAHDARDDAVAQAMDVQCAYRVLQPIWALSFPAQAT